MTAWKCNHRLPVIVLCVAVLPTAATGCRDSASGTPATPTREASPPANVISQSTPNTAETSPVVTRSPTAAVTGGTRPIVHRAAEPIDYDPDRQAFAEEVQPFLQNHCVRCHGPQQQEADFRVDQHLPNDFLDRRVTERWSEVLNMLNSGQMPPEGEPQPSAEQSGRIAAWIEQERLRAEMARNDRTIVLRRMNRQEYNNTIRDLLGVELNLVDDFPEEPPAGGFDNNGSALNISPLHLDLYLQTARKVLDRALVDESEGPGTIRWRFEIEEGRPGSAGRRVRLDDDRNRSVHVECGPRPPRDGMIVLRWWGEGCAVQYFHPPRAGTYIVRVRAAGKTPEEEFVRAEGPKIELLRNREGWQNLSPDEREKRQEGYDRWRKDSVAHYYANDRTYRYGPPRMRILGYLGSRRPVLDQYDVPAPVEAPEVYESRVLLTTEKTSLFFSNPYRIPYTPHFNPHFVVQRDDFPRPELFIDWIEIEGPVHDGWPPSSHRRILVDSPLREQDEVAYAREVIARFLQRAWRIPLRDGEVEAKVELFRRVRPMKPSFVEAIKVPLITALASPHFLYLVEDVDPGNSPRPLNDYELASRLSYLLWSSMPDEELLEIAAARQLTSDDTLRAQVDRMLADDRSEAFVKNFAGQWLELRKVGTNPPTVPRYDEHLESSMRGESEAFFRHVLQNDRKVLDFLESDYITINERMARFYDIPGVRGDHFRPVPVPPGSHRGGLLGQASILAITSNGTRTSPVWRGVWILRNLLGDPPPPPPPNAGDIPPVDPDAQPVTLRQRLQLHREQPQCARCHDQIDPLGFALENFDHSGEWRERDGDRGNSPPIDAAASLPDGTEFIGVDGLRRELLNREDAFLRCLAGKVFAYALGRELGYGDAQLTAEAVEYCRSRQLTLRSLLHFVVTSDEFRTR